ncbi:hypothetical protein G7085_06500 [Tessaracoccus sp. HDW20]|uniref:hypothetical protein n=1 Tax=Tessaracoccus coleopterorum TaxID=2714950 RepID=UPI0018D38DD1|nr:hypothetical protein [Tessaracoccus coleopterorum]NHB84376.1 hypothetical protein [Tessaracoccus coleopterorum]
MSAEADLERARAELLLGRSDDAIRHARRAARSFAARDEPFWERRCRLAALIARPSPGGPPVVGGGLDGA